MVVVVLPTPPFWLHIATIRAGPWVSRGTGSGNTGIGRPVGPMGRCGAPATAGATGAVEDAATGASICTAGTCGAWWSGSAGSTSGCWGDACCSG
jgi:hypothetical protein